MRTPTKLSKSRFSKITLTDQGQRMDPTEPTPELIQSVDNNASLASNRALLQEIAQTIGMWLL